MVRLEPEIHAADIEQAAREKTGRDEQRHRQRHLRRGERTAEPPRGFRPRRLAGPALEHRREVRTRAVERGEQAEHDPGRERQPEGEKEHRRTQLELYEPRPVGRHHRRHQAERPPRHDDAGDAAEEGEQARLDEQLPHELPPARADRQPHRHLGRARRGARQQQVRDVGARDEHHHAGDREQQEQRRARLAVQAALAAMPRLDRDLPRAEPLHRRVAHPGLQRGLDVVDDRLVRDVGRGARLVDRDARLQAGKEVRPVGAAVLELVPTGNHQAAHRDRHVDLRVGAQRGAFEAVGRDADDDHWLAVDGERLTDNVRARVEPRAPVVVAEHGDEVPADRRVVARLQEPAQGRLDAEHREVAARHQHAAAVEGLPLVREVGAERHVRRHAREDRLVFLQVAEHQVAEHLIAVTRLVARLRPGLGTRRAQVDQPLRRLDGQGAHEHLVEERVNGGVGPDAEGERHDRHRRDEGALEQGTERELDVSHVGESLVCYMRRSSETKSLLAFRPATAPFLPPLVAAQAPVAVTGPDGRP